MDAQRWIVTGCLLIVTFVATDQATCQSTSRSPQPLVITLSDTTTHYQPLLNGSPETIGMESGYVILMPGKSGSEHSSEGYEETLVVIS
jgi:hypothetical protein